ncbi:MAG: PrsW family glutamic-type intramembrane protease [Pyrinomonadaceae bacterium]
MKLQIVINSGSLAGQRFDLEGGFLTIGRSEVCSIRFDPLSERIASKQHAFIEAKADGFYITDNQSMNGTIVNGQRVQSVKLQSGDTVQFGSNGVIAEVQISNATPFQAPFQAQESFRAEQVQRFEEIAMNQPEGVQNSIAHIGLGHLEPVAAPAPGGSGRYIGISVTIFAIVFMSLIVIALIFLSVGIIPAIIAAVVAFVPAVLYVLPLIWLDRYDPEPIWLLALAFAWGALVAVIVSFVINTALAVLFGPAIAAVFSAPIFEEGSKGLGLILLLVFFRRYFDDILDGIVFAGVIALGFATVENVMYYGQALGELGAGGLIAVFFMRGILSPFAHVTFTSMTGIGCGIARESHNIAVRLILPVIGYIAAVTLHAIWNGMAVLAGLEGFLIGYLILEIPFFLLFVGFSFYIMYRQNKILKDMLAIDVARGLIPQAHVATATSAFKSSGWLLGGLFDGKFKARSRYLRAIGNLGLSYWHIQRATAAQGQTGSFQQNPILREEVLKWRDQV